MRRLLTLALAAVAVSFVAGGAYAGGLGNGDFETVTPSVDDGVGGWNYWDNGNSIAFGGQADATTTGPGAHTGTGYGYMHLQMDAGGWPSASITQVADLTNQIGTRLRTSWWYNTNYSVSSDAMDIQCYWSDPGVTAAPPAGWWQNQNDPGAGFTQYRWDQPFGDNYVKNAWTQKVSTKTVTPQNQGGTPYHPNFVAITFRAHTYSPDQPADFSLAVDDVAIYLIPPGDANQDGAVSVGDLGILAANYGTTGGATWTTSDFNGDGNVTVGDLGILAANYGVNNLAGGAVPEPATLSLLGLGVLALRRRR